jgi:hypothetical protein
MIQRIQTLYLLLAIMACSICLCLPVGRLTVDGRQVGEMYNLWILTANGGHDFAPWVLFTILLTTIPVSIFGIFTYHRRVIQSRLCLFNILISLSYYIVYAILVLFLKEKYQSNFTLEFCSVLPSVGLIFNFFARKAILKDEKIVRAADRIR